MRVRINIKTSKVRDSKLWNYDVEEFINSKWHMAMTYNPYLKNLKFYGGQTEDKDLAIRLARDKAQEYISDRERFDHATVKEFVKQTNYIEEIKIDG